MNQVNCSAYFATDRLFMKTPPGTCNSSLLAFYFFSLVVILRYIPAYLRWKRYAYRRQTKQFTSALPVFLSILFCIVQTVTFFLILFDVINVDNGWSFSLYSVNFAIFATSYFIDFLRIVRLGIQIGAVPLVADATSDISVSKDAVRSIQSFDGVGLILLLLSGISMIIMTVALIILSPIFPSHEIVLGVIGFVSKGFFIVFVTTGLIWQLERCYRFVSIKMPENNNMKVRALKKFRVGQLSYFLFGYLPCIYYFLLASQIFPWYWYCLFGLSALIETSNQVVLECRKGSMRYYSTQSTHARQQLPHNQPQSPQRQHDGQVYNSKETSSAATSNYDSSGANERKQRTFLGLGIHTKKFRSPNRNFRLNLSKVTEEAFSVSPVTEIS